jgi:SPP1 family predicted phage head-tail adaptor
MIGSMDRVIKFYTRNSSIDAFGGASDVYSFHASCFAGISKDVTKDNNEEISGKQTANRNAHFAIRYRSDLNEDMIIEHSDELGLKYYKIESINEITTKRRKAFIAIEGTKFDLDLKIT